MRIEADRKYLTKDGRVAEILVFESGFFEGIMEGSRRIQWTKGGSFVGYKGSPPKRGAGAHDFDLVVDGYLQLNGDDDDGKMY